MIDGSCRPGNCTRRPSRIRSGCKTVARRSSWTTRRHRAASSARRATRARPRTSARRDAASGALAKTYSWRSSPALRLADLGTGQLAVAGQRKAHGRLALGARQPIRHTRVRQHLAASGFRVRARDVARTVLRRIEMAERLRERGLTELRERGGIRQRLPGARRLSAGVDIAAQRASSRVEQRRRRRARSTPPSRRCISFALRL